MGYLQYMTPGTGGAGGIPGAIPFDCMGPFRPSSWGHSPGFGPIPWGNGTMRLQPPPVGLKKVPCGHAGVGGVWGFRKCRSFVQITAHNCATRRSIYSGRRPVGGIGLRRIQSGGRPSQHANGPRVPRRSLHRNRIHCPANFKH